MHPDQHAGAADDVRRAAERRMQEINAAWEVLSDPGQRRAYDAGLRAARPRPTGPVVSSRPRPTGPIDGGRARRPSTRYDPGVGSTEISGFARLFGVKALLGFAALVVGVLVLTVVLRGGGGGSGAADDDGDELPFPGAVALGCIDIAPEVIEVPCLQSHDAIVWATVNAGESCPDGTEGFFRPAVGVYCATLVVG